MQILVGTSKITRNACQLVLNVALVPVEIRPNITYYYSLLTRFIIRVIIFFVFLDNNNIVQFLIYS